MMKCNPGDTALVINCPHNQGATVRCVTLLPPGSHVGWSKAFDNLGDIWLVDRPLWWLHLGMAFETEYAPARNLMPIRPDREPITRETEAVA